MNFRNKHLTSISICSENDLAAASSHHYGTNLSAEAGMAGPLSPKMHSGPAPSAHTSSYTNCRYMQYCTGQRKAIESWQCIQLGIIIDMTKPPLCSWATGGAAVSSGSTSMSFKNQWIQVAIPMLLLCAPRHFCFYFRSEIRKTTSTCSNITTLLILCSSGFVHLLSSF